MINKDYILRLFERFGRELSIILGLRQRNRQEDALIHIDDLLLQAIGLSSRFIDTLSPEMLLAILSPMGRLNVESCLWAAFLLKNEGDIYEAMGQSKESYYRYIKALLLLLEVQLREPVADEMEITRNTADLLKKLEDFDLPHFLKNALFAYYEQQGHYSKAEDYLFEMLEDMPGDTDLVKRGIEFYMRLLKKNDFDLQSGDLPRQEVEEGLAQLRRMKKGPVH
ncbi:MAG: hypothetical protein IMW89_01090 [Ktedonobacteraceae bacterium]|nr:hypothetical protein [Ktedonobacteraceae bacterium]